MILNSQEVSYFEHNRYSFSFISHQQSYALVRSSLVCVLSELIVHCYIYAFNKSRHQMKDCPGSAAVHDIQLSQLPRQAFRELSDPIPVFYYDWSGRTAIDMKRTVKQEFTVTSTGRAQMVFMWWELNMDTEGKLNVASLEVSQKHTLLLLSYYFVFLFATADC